MCFLSAGVWVGAGCSLSELHSVLEKLVPQFPEEKTEVFRALNRQLGNLGSVQIRNVAVRRNRTCAIDCYYLCFTSFLDLFPPLLHILFPSLKLTLAVALTSRCERVPFNFNYKEQELRFIGFCFNIILMQDPQLIFAHIYLNI